MCNERGGVIDDLYAYRTGELDFLLVINASRIDPDVAWLNQQHANFAGRDGVRLENLSDTLGAVAVQGPRVAQFIDACFPGASQVGTRAARVTELRKNEIGQWQFAGQPVWIGRTGYTGEDGFEIITAADVIEAVWSHVLAQGHVGCLQPCGLGARDTLRTEVCYPLYGHELDEDTTPIEAGLGIFVALDKGEFSGRAALAQQKAGGVAKKCVAFRMTAKSAPPRPGYAIWAGGTKVGAVVSGTQSPSLNGGIGLGYVPPEWAAPGTALEIEIRGQRHPAEVLKKPIYRKA
jgi:aminomethyltransferase